MERLRDLRARLLRLHALLLEEERSAYARQHGASPSGFALLQVVLHDPQFAWLRALSGMIAEIDAALDEADGGGVTETDVQRFVGQARRLLRSGGSTTFDLKYRGALQRSPAVVMAHAAVAKLF